MAPVDLLNGELFAMSSHVRCEWAESSPEMREYHDREWGVPVYDDRVLFEFLTLEGAQAGLSWQTILNRRPGYRATFAQFDIAKVASMTSDDIDRAVRDPAIIRNRGKIESTVSNAKVALEVIEEHGSLSDYLWHLIGGGVIQNRIESIDRIPATTPESKAMSKALKTRGFRFVGPTICYAFMQAVGMVNDHRVDCFRYNEVGG